jgi:hypothetical protein
MTNDTLQWCIQVLVPIIVAMFGSTWFGDFLSRIRHGNVSNSEVMQTIKKLDAKVEEGTERYYQDKANQQRMQILRFDDELRQGLGHSHEFFDNILIIIDEYEQYCSDHPGYKNKKASSAIEHIMEAYDECHANNSFI